MCIHEWRYSISGFSFTTGSNQVSNLRRYCWKCRQRESFDIWKDYKWPLLEGIVRVMGLKVPLKLVSITTKTGWRKL